MKKFLLLFAASLLLAGCHEKDEAYYWNHPDALQQQLEQCPDSAKEADCKELQAIAAKMQDLAYELQQGPQYFGKKILALQEKIARQEKTATRGQVDADKRLLWQMMAIVKKYESPEG